MNIDYQELLEKARTEYDMFSFLWREKRQVGESGFDVQEELAKYFVNEQLTDEWPGTKIFYGKELLCFYSVNSETFRILGRVLDIFDWGEKGMPEDLAFYKDEVLLFTSISHEREAWYEKI